MKPEIKHEIIEWIKTITISIAIAMVITMFVRPTLVKGYSMFPTLDQYDYLIINKVPYMMHEPERGDIVVFKSHLKTIDGRDKDLIKRVIGVPGDRIQVEHGNVYVNGEQVIEDYISGDYTSGEIDMIVPEETVFVMGDNRENSMDSRDDRVGPVPMDTILGKAFVRLFPFTKIGKIS